MTNAELRDHIATLQRLKRDTATVEAKASTGELPKHLWKTLSAFSNTHGGTILLGPSERVGYEVISVKNPARIAEELANVCVDMEPSVRLNIEIHRIDGRFLVTAEVPELPKQAKPCYHRDSGYTNGAYIRVNDSNRKLNQYEVFMMLSARGQPKEDEAPVAKTSVDDLNPRLLKGFLSRLRKRPNGHFLRLSDERIFRTVKVLVPVQNRFVCSVAALLAFGKYPQQFFPSLNLTLLVNPGTSIGEPGPNYERFLDNERIDGAIPDMLAPTFRVLRRNMKRRAVVNGLYRSDVEEYPEIAVREVIINALAHRDLSSWGQGTPVQVQMFSDRLVIHNPGGLYGPVTVDDLGKEGIQARRNLLLMQLLEDTPAGGRHVVCENRGSGIGAMTHSLRAASLPDPEFEDKIATFRVTLFNSPILQRRNRREEIMALLREHGELSTPEIAVRLKITSVAVRKWLVNMRAEGSIESTEEKARSKNMRYRLARKS